MAHRIGGPGGNAHGRVLLFGIGALIILGTLPVFAHHLPLPRVESLAATERVGAICLVALYLVLAPVHGLIHVLLGAGAAYAMLDYARGRWHLARALGALDVVVPRADSRVALIAARLGLPSGRIMVARAPGNPAFTFGSFSPRICVSESLIAVLSDSELRSVLAHESCHLRRRDPLRLAVLRFLALTLFWIPALRRISEDVAIELEFDADAAGAQGEPLVMASALLKAASERSSLHLALSTGLVRDELLAARVRRLAGEVVTLPSRITRRTIAGATVALAVVWLSGAVVAHPLHTEAGADAVCLEHAGWPGSHIFCARHVAGDDPCPHAMGDEPVGHEGLH